jgi:hypothetical protein
VLGWNAETAAQKGTRQVPRLVVNITIDQLRSDFLEAYAPLYGETGFKKLMTQGRVYENASYPLVQPDRASAISTVLTGTVPYYHSIVGQSWINRETLRPQYCTEDNRQNGIVGPHHLAVSTLGDEMKVASDGKALVYAVAPFADAAVLSAGHAADGALWLDEQNGQWTTSQYYSSGYPIILLGFNELSHPSRDIERLRWVPLGQERIFDFRHVFKGHKKYQEYQTSGLINAHMTDLALAYVRQKGMGKDSITDLLCLTYYAGPLGHQPMSECQLEMKDTYLRLDQSIGALISQLEEKIDRKDILFVVTSTGYCDPEQTDYAKYRIPTGTFYINRAAGLLNMYFGAIWGQGRYIETCTDNQLYINHKLLEQKRVALTDFCQRARDFLLQMEGVKNVYNALQLLSENNSHTAKVRNGFHPQHNGDILIEVNPGWHLQNEETGEDRVSLSSAIPFPIILYGADIQSEQVNTPVTTDRIAPTLSRAIRIRAPNACSSEPLF